MIGGQRLISQGRNWLCVMNTSYNMKVFRRFLSRQAKNIVKMARGKSVNYPSLGSMTLDKDDVAIARQWLRNRADWDNKKVVSEYEAAFARWNGSKHAFAFMGGRVALSACIYALDLKPDDEVILPGYTCVVVRMRFNLKE